MTRAPPIGPPHRQLPANPAHRAGVSASHRRSRPLRRPLRTILALSRPMPRDEIQGLFFLLGLLLAFYFLTPFLALAGR
jgi:hypothetical protein